MTQEEAFKKLDDLTKFAKSELNFNITDFHPWNCYKDKNHVISFSCSYKDSNAGKMTWLKLEDLIKIKEYLNARDIQIRGGYQSYEVTYDLIFDDLDYEAYRFQNHDNPWSGMKEEKLRFWQDWAKKKMIESNENLTEEEKNQIRSLQDPELRFAMNDYIELLEIKNKTVVTSTGD